MDSEYKFTDGFRVSDQMKTEFIENGYILVRNVFNKLEVNKLKDALEHDEGIVKHAYQLNDGFGKKFKMCLWKNPGNDITGLIARCEKVATTSEELLGGSVYHFHTKLMMKEAEVGGQHAWHQDYGYWYNNGYLFPDLLTVFTAVDPCMKINGCLQVIKGSHKCGRLDHLLIGGQQGADPERISQIEKRLQLVDVEMQPGDALFFHSNLLHRSGCNESPTRRWAFLIAYSLSNNIPYGEDNYGPGKKLEKVPDSAIKDCTNYTDMTGKDFLNPREDKTVKYEEEK